jgi:hypothetical protein
MVHSFRTSDGVTHGVEHFGDAAAPLVLLAGATTMLSWPDALCETLAADATWCATPCATPTRRSPSTPRHRRARCATWPQTPPRWPADSTTGRRTWLDVLATPVDDPVPLGDLLHAE